MYPVSLILILRRPTYVLLEVSRDCHSHVHPRKMTREGRISVLPFSRLLGSSITELPVMDGKLLCKGHRSLTQFTRMHTPVLLPWKTILIPQCTWATPTFVRSPYPPVLAITYIQANSILLKYPEPTHKVTLDFLFGLQHVFCVYSVKCI